MRITIHHRDRTRGLFRPFRQIEVSVSVHFSEVEHHVIRFRQLGDFVVLTRQPDTLTARRRDFFGFSPTEPSDLLVRDLLRPRPARFLCDTPAHAKIYERSLADALQRLKFFLADNESVGADRTFDF
jgi:hypothetical protein